MLVANIGVLAGIIFVAVEIRQNTQMMRAQTKDSVTGKLADWMLQISTDPNAAQILIKGNLGEELDREVGERIIYRFMVQSNLRLWENEWYQYEIGLFDEDEFAPRLANWENIFQAEGYREIWAGIGQYHSEGFREIIDGFLVDN